MRTVSPLLRTAWQPRCQGPRAVCSAAADVQPRRVPHTNELLTPYEMAGVQLQHRVVYAPLTRCRAEVCRSRRQFPITSSGPHRPAQGGLLISEATCVAKEGHGYRQVPGIYTQEQIEAWRPVVDAVHAAGGVFYLQLWHCGRASHPDYQPHGAPPPAPSAIAIGPDWQVYTPSGQAAAYPVPRELGQQEIARIVEQFADGARNAIAAGFDGVEIHGANGYIIDQFLKSSSNHRSDEYGGPLENRARFALEVTRAVVDAVGAERTAIRLAPFTTFLDAIDDDPVALGTYMTDQLNPLGLAYLHMVEPRVPKGTEEEEHDASFKLSTFRDRYKGTFMSAGGYTRERGIEAIRDGSADLIAYGRLFLANPDLPERFALDAPLNPYDRSTFYSSDPEKGYTDYPFLSEVAPEKAEQLAALV